MLMTMIFSTHSHIHSKTNINSVSQSREHLFAIFVVMFLCYRFLLVGAYISFCFFFVLSCMTLLLHKRSCHSLFLPYSLDPHLSSLFKTHRGAAKYQTNRKDWLEPPKKSHEKIPNRESTKIQTKIIRIIVALISDYSTEYMTLTQ